jgi:hypothetical protein
MNSCAGFDSRSVHQDGRAMRPDAMECTARPITRVKSLPGVTEGARDNLMRSLFRDAGAAGGFAYGTERVSEFAAHLFAGRWFAGLRLFTVLDLLTLLFGLL